MSDDNIFKLPDIAAANAAFDAQWGPVSELGHIRAAWQPAQMLRKGKLTDKQLAKYEKLGWYSAEFQKARKDAWTRKKLKQAKREGNFDIAADGRLIYRPL